MTKKDRVAHLLTNLTWTHAALAKLADVDEATIRRWRKGVHIPQPLNTAMEGNLAYDVEAMVEGVLRARGHTPRESLHPSAFTSPDDIEQQIIVADAHLSKLCWPQSTGGEAYDLTIARKLILNAVKYLAGREGMCHSRVLGFLGDYFHYDTLMGTTTAGTSQDRDSRLPKMLDVGAELAVEMIDYCARLGKVKVLIVPGNHDAVLTSALQRILIAEFRNIPHVTIDGGHTARKYHEFGRNGFLYTHGDRRKKELPATFATEQAALWGRTTHREIHTGHLHTEIEQYNGTLSHQGCLMRTHPSMSPPDQWHADEQYVGSARGMKAYTYHVKGGEIASYTATPNLLR